MANAQAQSNRQMRQQERREERQMERQMERREAPRDFRESRYNDLREARERSYEGRIDESQNSAEPPRRNGRMTADERRDLRRQINEAGQQVYSLPPRR
nr:hypothetical protein [Massilia eburnea]